MKSKVKYTNEPMGRLRVIDDFLSRPDKLVFKEDNVKVTMALSKSPSLGADDAGLKRFLRMRSKG